MLIKKELLTIPPSEFPTDIQLKHEYAVSVHTVQLPKSGEILVVDIFNSNDRTLKLRFFSDRKSFIGATSWAPVEWSKRNPNSVLGFWPRSSARKSDVFVVSDFLNMKDYSNDITSLICQFADEKKLEKRDKEKERKYQLRKKHFELYPSYPSGLPEFCERVVFKHTYIFVDKVQKDHRKGVCGHCGQRLKLGRSVSSGMIGACPKCGTTGKYRGVWVRSPVDRNKICITHKVDGQLLIRWADVERTYGPDFKPVYEFQDYYRNLYLNTKKGQVVYAYFFHYMAYYGWDWYRKPNGSTYYKKTFLYTENLTEVFGKSYYNVDLQDGLQGKERIDFASLLSRLKRWPVAEYLFKLGLPALTAELYHEEIQDGEGFYGRLGVSKQYLPLYQKYNVSYIEHRIIKTWLDMPDEEQVANKVRHKWIDEDSFLKLRSLQPAFHDIRDITRLLNIMSFKRFVNYFYKQKIIRKSKQLSVLLSDYDDYISMSESLNVDFSRKSVRFPKDLKTAHDFILERFNKVKYQAEDEQFKVAVSTIYPTIRLYEDQQYCVKLPESRSDLIREGQSLGHCVGNNRYSEQHMEGKRMIFFIRCVDEREKPFFTLEIDMEAMIIRQLYGTGNRSAPHDVRKFAEKYLSMLKKSQMNNKAIA